MTRPDALRTILRAQTYITYLSLEDAGTGHETRLADELGEALKALSEPEPRKPTWNCRNCGMEISDGITACPKCLPGMAGIGPFIDPADTPTRVIPAAEMIRVEPVGRCEVCGWTLAIDAQDGCVPGNCYYRPDDPTERQRIAARRKELAAKKAQQIINDLAARTFAQLVWSDRPSEAETVPPNYQVDQGPNGWSAYYFADARDNVPDISTDGCFPTRESAKAWCQGHADGEALEPRRCERCKMPTSEALPLCTSCEINGELLNGQAVKVAASDFTF